MSARSQGGTEPAKGCNACESLLREQKKYEALIAQLIDRLKTKATTGREKCESALREQGIDEDFLAKKLKNQLEAKNRRWNSEKKSWEEFDDCGSQLAALREICKIFGAFPSPESLLKENNRPPVIIDISAIPRGK